MSKQDEEESEDNIFNNLKSIKWTYVILALIILIAAIGIQFVPKDFETPGRLYNLDFPSIGYHNMKENEYLSQAWNYYHHTGGFVDYFRRSMHILGMEAGPGYYEEYPEMPLLPWMFLFAWKIGGIHFWIARLIIVLFSLGSIILLYLVVKKLTKDNEYLAILSAGIMAILPLSVFFGRNIQPDSPALFALLLMYFFYLRWIESEKTWDIVFLGLATALCGNFKPTFLIGFIPMAAIFPYGKVWHHIKEKAKRNLVLKQVGLFLLCASPFVIWNFIISPALNTKYALLEGTFSRINLFDIFTSGYWQAYTGILTAYVNDNYAIWFLWFALIGMIFLIMKFKTKLSKFMIAYAIAIIPYCMIVSDYIKAHSYYQLPFVPLVCVASAYFLYTLGTFITQIMAQKDSSTFLIFSSVLSLVVGVFIAIIGNIASNYAGKTPPNTFVFALIIFIIFELLLCSFYFISKQHLSKFGKFIPVLLLILTLPAVQSATNRQFDTVFFGLDVAADYLKTHSSPSERLSYDGGPQTVGICYNADRRCTWINNNVSDVQFGEEQRNMSWYFIDISQGGMMNLNKKPDVLAYIQENYHIAQIGLTQQNTANGQTWVPYYILLKKGGTSNLLDLSNNTIVRSPVALKKTYQMTYGQVPFYAVDE